MTTDTTKTSPELPVGTLPLNQRQSMKPTPCHEIVKRLEVPTLREHILKKGYAAITGELPSQVEFAAVYALFDQLVNSRDNEKLWARLDDEAICWQAMAGNKAAYAGAPAGFTDRLLRIDRAEKRYFQFCSEFYHYLRSYRDSSYYQNVRFAILCDRMMELTETAERIFKQALHELDDGKKTLSRAVGDDRGELSVLLKLLAYEPSPSWATTPHFDKSAFSLVMNADDIEQENFRIAPYHQAVTIDDLKEPQRKPRDKHSPGIGLLFPGLCLRSVGVGDLPPSPHGVVPISNDRRRHSLIAFLIAPDVDTTAMDTNDMNLDASFR